MKSTHFKTILFFILIIASFGCGIKQESKLVIYGSNTCNHCIQLKKALDDADTNYQFYDIDIDKAKEMEMVAKLKKFNVRGNISLPVVDVYGKELLVGTTYDAVAKSIKNQK